MNWRLYHFIIFLFYLSCSKDQEDNPQNTFFNYTSFKIEGQKTISYIGTSLKPKIIITFSEPIDHKSIPLAVRINGVNSQNIQVEAQLSNQDTILTLSFTPELQPLTKYTIEVNTTLVSINKHHLSSTIEATISTGIDTTNKFPLLSDSALLTKIQHQTFKYFWDFGHPISGMARERNTSGDLVTSGGTGFGIMAIIVGIHRGFISREQGLQRIMTISDFLMNKSERFHGVFPHWLNGNSGETIPFSAKDDGGDLVETSYLLAGLLCVYEFFDKPIAEEQNLRAIIKNIWDTVEWSWHTKGNGDVLYWHWSPKYNWDMNHQIKGWNEALITYILAASSPTFGIAKGVYDHGWASEGSIKNGKSFYDIPLPLGQNLGGPLFFEHYSFLGINPTKLNDQYANYWTQAVNHTKINYSYCVENPRGYYGYSKDNWGLTASDTYGGYTAHSPNNDKGVISPTAALSSFPYTPNESMDALKFFYYKLGDKIFKEYGFVDAFSLHHLWFADSFLAIDQGPIIIMIENHRTGLIWDLLMRNNDIKAGLDKLGFTY